VAVAWVGTTITQSASLETVIRSVLESGRTVTFAVKRAPPPVPIVGTTIPGLNDVQAGVGAFGRADRAERGCLKP
jgi:hypothetical protein